MLKFVNVTKQFGSIEALTDVSFAIDPGEMVFVTGPSGAGKTTLLRLLIHEYAPTSGEIYYSDFQVHDISKRQIPKLRQNIGSVFQDFRLLSNRTLEENVLIPLVIKKTPKDEWAPRIEQVLNLVGLSERANLFPSQLSGGELQRAAIARALVTNPDLVFADEPTGNLDQKTAEEIMKLLKKINEEGKTIIITTHNRGIVDEFGDRIMDIEKGKLVNDSKPKSINIDEVESEDESEDLEDQNKKENKKKKKNKK